MTSGTGVSGQTRPSSTQKVRRTARIAVSYAAPIRAVSSLAVSVSRSRPAHFTCACYERTSALVAEDVAPSAGLPLAAVRVQHNAVGPGPGDQAHAACREKKKTRGAIRVGG